MAHQSMMELRALYCALIATTFFDFCDAAVMSGQCAGLVMYVMIDQKWRKNHMRIQEIVSPEQSLICKDASSRSGRFSGRTDMGHRGGKSQCL